MLEASRIAPDVLRPLARGEYERLVAAGCFDDERVELLDGVLVHMSPHGPAHDAALERLTRLFVIAVEGRVQVRVQSAFAAGDESEPEPDLALVPLGSYEAQHPHEALLIVEVAGTSLVKDRGVKAALYAASRVPEYWVVNLVDRLVEVHTDIVGSSYARVTPYRPGERISVTQLANVSVLVSDVLR